VDDLRHDDTRERRMHTDALSHPRKKNMEWARPWPSPMAYAMDMWSE